MIYIFLQPPLGKSFKDNKGYAGRTSGPGSLSLAQAPKKKVVRPIQLSSLKSESNDPSSSTTTASSWAARKDDRNIGKTSEQTKIGTSTAASTARPWSSSRGVPGLNQPEPQRTEFTELGAGRERTARNGNGAAREVETTQRSEPKKQNPMLPNYLKHNESKHNDEPIRNGNRAENDYKDAHDSNQPAAEEKMDAKSRSDSDGYGDDYDPMESWADDKPVNWNEKIIFSDEDKPPSPKPEEVKPRGEYITFISKYCIISHHY